MKAGLLMARALTQREISVIVSLKRLARRWPDSLQLVSAAGTLVVVRTDDDREREFADRVVAEIDGIPNDGGDPW